MFCVMVSRGISILHLSNEEVFYRHLRTTIVFTHFFSRQCCLKIFELNEKKRPNRICPSICNKKWNFDYKGNKQNDKKITFRIPIHACRFPKTCDTWLFEINSIVFVKWVLFFYWVGELIPRLRKSPKPTNFVRHLWSMSDMGKIVFFWYEIFPSFY